MQGLSGVRFLRSRNHSPHPRYVDQHPCVQTSTLSRQTALLRLWSFPRHSRAWVYPSQHPTSTWQGLYQSFLRWGHWESKRRLGKIFEHCCRPSITAGMAIVFVMSSCIWRSGTYVVFLRLEVKCSALSYKTRLGTGRNGSEWRLLTIEETVLVFLLLIATAMSRGGQGDFSLSWSMR